MDAARPLTELTDYRKAQTPPMSLADVARLLRVTPAAVSRWERGKRSPNLVTLVKIAQLIDTPASQLAGLDQ